MSLFEMPRGRNPADTFGPRHYSPAPWTEPAQQRISAGGFTFRFIVGTAARQLYPNNYPCKQIIVVAPGPDFAEYNRESIFYGIGQGAFALDEASEWPPGTSETIHIDNTTKLWVVGQNNTDIIFGRVEA